MVYRHGLREWKTGGTKKKRKERGREGRMEGGKEGGAAHLDEAIHRGLPNGVGSFLVNGTLSGRAH